MFKLNLKIAIRNLFRSKTASFINICGLAIGLAASLLLLLYVSYEWNYDKQFKKIDNIYQVMANFHDTNKKIFLTDEQTSNNFAAVLKAEAPEVEYIARTVRASKRLLANGKNTFKVDGRYADPDWLNIFDYKYISGNREKALSDPNSIVLTESTAKRLFGTTDALNKVVRFENQADLKVTAVIEDIPANTTYSFECLTPWRLFENLNDWVIHPEWHNYSFYSLLTLKKGTDVDAFNAKIKDIIRTHSPSDVIDVTPFVYPLSKKHLYSEFVNGKAVGGQITQVRIFIALALGILIIACINFMNLATARSQKRAKEVGIKKTIGASRKSLITQFILESLLLTIISVILAVVLVELALPKFNHLLNIKISIAYGNVYNWIALIGLILFTGTLAGSYPAFFLSSFDPLETLKRPVKASNGLSLNFRQILVVVQFSFAIILIVATMIIYQQLQYIKNKPVGYELNSLVEISHEGNLYLKFDLLKERLLASGSVTSVCQSSGSLSRATANSAGMEWQGMSQADKRMVVDQIYTAYDFTKTAGIKMVEGRDFQKEHASDSTGIMLSQLAVHRMGLKNPVGQTVVFQDVKRTVVGVFADIVWGDPTKKAPPMVIAFNKGNSNVITMRLNGERPISDNLAQIEQITKSINPDFPVDIKFVDKLVGEKVKNERILSVLSNLFGGLAIFISCLGLFGLSAFSAEQRTKEIGVRKVLGASVVGIMRLLSISFVRTVLVALVIALPAAYFMMNHWLVQFDYRITIGWQVFFFTAFSTVFIALSTVSWQAFRAAKSNPVDALKYE